jgi:hypothetical protein
MRYLSYLGIFFHFPSEFEGDIVMKINGQEVELRMTCGERSEGKRFRSDDKKTGSTETNFSPSSSEKKKKGFVEMKS